MSKISSVILLVAVKRRSDGKRFTLLRTWIPPRMGLKLAAVALAVLNSRFLGADSPPTVEDILTGLPILRHLGTDTKAFLESRRDLLNGVSCSLMLRNEEKTGGGPVSAQMITCVNCIAA